MNANAQAQPQYDASGISTQVAPQYAPQPIIINNSAAASASATSGYGAGVPLVRKRQSLKVHFWLLMLTGGIGNIFYAIHCNRTLAVRVSH